MSTIAVETSSVQSDFVTVLNASYEVLSENYTWQQAARLIALGKAVIVEADPLRRLRSASVEWAFPKVIQLREFVKIAYNKVYGPPMVSKRNVLRRDKYICGYCGRPAMTIDHIHPRSKGGGNTWENLIAACQPCNNKKDNKDLKDTNLRLLWTPFVPTKAQVK